jgi:FPC/CPF motif-containing protein YcgG
LHLLIFMQTLKKNKSSSATKIEPFLSSLPTGASCSPFLYKPNAQDLVAYCPDEAQLNPQQKLQNIHQEILKLMMSKNYPCAAAMRAVSKQDYMVGVYSKFGTGQSSAELSLDLLFFLDKLGKTKSANATFWAVFPDSVDSSPCLAEDRFESNLWSELSFLAAANPYCNAWDASVSTNPADKNFCFSLGGSAFFVVGLHAFSSRRARRFPYPALVFNTLGQFEQLVAEDKYDHLVQTSRKRDRNYKGNVNPMVEKYGDSGNSLRP